MFKKTPNITSLKSVLETAEQNMTETGNGWVPARPEGFHSIWYRLKATWLVFTGQADALKWPEGQ